MSKDPNVNANGAFTKSIVTVAALPAASAQNAGVTAWVSDANASPFTNRGSTAAGSGTYKARVVSDGTAWKLAP